MRFGIISDEIDQDFRTAAEFGVRLGVRHFEVRNLKTGRIPLVSKEELRSVQETIKDLDIEIVSLSPGLFKIPMDPEEVKYHQGTVTEKCFETLDRLGVNKVIVFGFFRNEEMSASSAGIARTESAKIPAIAVDALGEFAEKALLRGVRVYLENEPLSHADTAKNIQALLKKIGHKNLMLNWDPANALFSGEEASYPVAYELLKKRVGHLHIKDAKGKPPDLNCVPLGEGMIDWKGQLRALAPESDDLFGMIETHIPKNPMKASETCWKKLMEIVKEIEKAAKAAEKSAKTKKESKR